MAQRLKASHAARLSNTPSPKPEFGFDDLSICASPSDTLYSSLRRTATRIDHESIGEALRKVLVEHQLGLSLNFILLLGLTYALFPSLRPTIESFYSLSYKNAPGEYRQGPRDLYLVTSFVIYFTAIRTVLLDYVLTPLAGLCGIKKKKAKVRFAEQSHILIYYTVYCAWGAYLWIAETPADVKTVDDMLISMWKDFPRLLLSPSMKLYYLTQLAFWIQQIMVLHLEEKRKDHYQMLTHHFITVGLMLGSYGSRQLRCGNGVLVCMDIVDWVFAFAKILRYLSLQTACDCAFGVFVLAWVLARHVAFGAICWSVYAHINVYGSNYGVYSSATGEFLSTDGGDKILEHLVGAIFQPDAPTFIWNAGTRNYFLVLLLSLQAIICVWLFMIIRVVIRVLKGHNAEDSRSDDEDDGEDVSDDGIEDGVTQPSAPITTVAEMEKPRFIEVETSSEDVNWPVRTSSAANRTSSGGTRKKSKGISSGLNLGEHKEILNRIGCLSEEQLAREREKREGSSSPQPPGRRGGKR